MISYPPLSNEKGRPTLGQNRQFQYFTEPTYIYPVVPAQAATLLKQSGYDVIWNDSIAMEWSHDKFEDFIEAQKPDLIALETKTPVVKQHWKIIGQIKTKNPQLKTVLFGDHVTALPEESLLHSKVDFVITGGDYDFLLLNLCDFLSRKTKSGFQVQLEPGIYWREGEEIKNSGVFKLEHNLDSLPFIDRDLTEWKLYAYKNGNYKRRPGTYIMSGRDCWWGRCSFCSWPTLYPNFRVRSPENVLNEIGQLIESYAIREIMDDTGSFPVGEWLRDFCCGMIKRGYNKKIYLDCNMRFGALNFKDFQLMKKANFRLLLFGLESANQETLDRIGKGLKKERIIQDCQLARQAGLYPHITIMFGYPWEDIKQATNTLNLGLWLLRKGYAYTMQATVVIPYPGSRLYQECEQAGLLKTDNWDDFDMKHSLMQTSLSEADIKRLVQGMYKVSFHPAFLLRKLFSIRDADDIRYYLRAAKKSVGHIFDFKNYLASKK